MTPWFLVGGLGFRVEGLGFRVYGGMDPYDSPLKVPHSNLFPRFPTKNQKDEGSRCLGVWASGV